MKPDNNKDQDRRKISFDLLIKHGWRCNWSMPSPKDFTQPFFIECWSKGGRVMLAQAWKEDGVTTYFQGGGHTWEELEAELAREAVDSESAIKPRVVNQQGLVSILEDMHAAVLGSDSFEGSISYSCMVEGLPPGHFEVTACYRIGNSEGQGGTRIVNAKNP